MDLFRQFNVATEMLSASVVQMAETLNTELAVTHSELLRPLALYSIYHVSQIYVRQCQRDPDPRYRHGIRALLKALGFFEQRWRIAGMPFQSIRVHRPKAHLHSRRVQGCDHFSTRAVQYRSMMLLVAFERYLNGSMYSTRYGEIEELSGLMEPSLAWGTQCNLLSVCEVTDGTIGI